MKVYRKLDVSLLTAREKYEESLREISKKFRVIYREYVRNFGRNLNDKRKNK